MSAKDQIEKEIRDACIFLREKNQTISSDTIQFILDASLEKLERSVSSRGNMLVEENLKKSIENCRRYMNMTEKQIRLLNYLGKIPSLQGLSDKEKLKASKFMYIELCEEPKNNIFPKIDHAVHGVPSHMHGNTDKK